MKYILMDLDGTITNPKTGITRSFQYALKAMDIFIDDLDSLKKHIGPPLKSSFLECYGFDDNKADLAVKKYREYYNEFGLYENEMYEGMESVLKGLQDAGKLLIVATSKPELIARKILEHFHLDHYFLDICGAAPDDSHSKKDEVIQYALSKNQIADLSEVVMVGDRKYDIEGAKIVGISSVGVLYGFGDREELEMAGADKIAASTNELYDILIQM
jgi:phosphoglycolate phosphatase